MSLSSVFTLALVLKKFTRKAALRKQAQQSASKNTKLSAASNIEQTCKLQSSSSTTTRASAPPRYNESETSLHSEKQKDELDTTVTKPIEIPPPSTTTEEEQLEDLGPEDPSGKSWSASLAAASLDSSSDESNTKGVQNVVVIRDYAYASSHPMHRGIPPISPIIEPTRPTSEVSLSSSEFTGRQAKALFDFEPESESECALRTGDIIWVQYRQCQGWLVADVGDETGLVPEEFVEWI